MREVACLFETINETIGLRIPKSGYSLFSEIGGKINAIEEKDESDDNESNNSTSEGELEEMISYMSNLNNDENINLQRKISKEMTTGRRIMQIGNGTTGKKKNGTNENTKIKDGKIGKKKRKRKLKKDKMKRKGKNEETKDKGWRRKKENTRRDK